MSLRMGSIIRIKSCLVILSCFFYVGIIDSSAARTTLGAGESLKDWEQLETSGGVFQLKFFSADSSRNRYLGIVIDGDNDAVWVANRKNPLNDSSGVVEMTQDGNLVITNRWGMNIPINSEQPSVNNYKSSNTSATLLESGNLVLRAGGHIVWQSFDYPTDTFLEGMKLGTALDLNTGRPRNRYLASWLSPQNAAPGTFTFGVDPNNTKQLAVWQREVVYWRSGVWNGNNFSYFLRNDLKFNYSFSYFSNEKESYFNFTTFNSGRDSWIYINPFGSIVQGVMNDSAWGAAGCDNDNSELTTIKGCVVPKPSKCRDGDLFVEIRGSMNWETELWNDTMGVSDCREICVRNCSCKAYASLSSDGSGCKFSQKLPDEGYGDLFYVRINTAVEEDHPRKRRLWLTVGAPAVFLTILTLVSVLSYLRWRWCCFEGKVERNKDGFIQETELLLYNASTSVTAIDELEGAHKLELRGKKGHELLLFNFSSIEIATDHFSDANKLGQGGFGPVYKGKLVQGQEIAVKRLSRNSGQGLEEFKNEIVLISKLQHRNLVRLLGCCIQGKEKILIYEYLPNNSLDSFLFDATKRVELDWKKRVCIIEGIAQGLLYLHKYSRLRIIHRDLKTSNILLDNEMNPKISDFGTARIFRENESQATTNRIVGTYGYMSPEYAMDGSFSVKSDVFSFGVMMLEIISGKKNTGFFQPNRPLNLLGHAWDLYREGRGLELMDLAIQETCSRNEVMRCVQIGLLCVQESAVDRPTMSDVVSMLNNESITLPVPKQPAFSNIVGIRANDVNLPENLKPCSINDVTITEMEAR